MHESHRRAAEQHELAATAHRMAAEYYEKGIPKWRSGIRNGPWSTRITLTGLQRKPTPSPAR